MHNPNPFDFVPFAEQPILKKESEFDAMGDLYSGYLELKIKALTPIHVVGWQEPEGKGRRSHFYRQNGEICIPAATIRGTLRAFIEALTAGWVSQANSEYKKVNGKKYRGQGRHIGFATFEDYTSKGLKSSYHMKAAVDPAYQPKAMEGDDPLLDVASYLFGIVVEKEKGKKTEHEALARKSRVWIEDAYINTKLDEQRYWIPDMSGKAFMGGGKPSISNWWYMQPLKYKPRVVDLGSRKITVTEFIGKKYWGRKFYFHQNPDNCVKYYEPESQKWPYPKSNFCKVNLECLRPKETTETFRIYINRIPKDLLILLVLSLFPGETIRHKLGYGKAYGYGSIEFSFENAMLRAEHDNQRFPKPLESRKELIQNWQALAWDQKLLGSVENLIDRDALNKLALVLGWTDYEKIIFTYPTFPKGYLFGIPIKYKSDFETRRYSPQLHNALAQKGLRLSTQSTIRDKINRKSKKHEGWYLTDGGSEDRYIAKEENGVINIYADTLYAPSNFAQPIYYDDFQAQINSKSARGIAEAIWNLKKTIHFRLYQEKSNGWKIIQSRKP